MIAAHDIPKVKAVSKAILSSHCSSGSAHVSDRLLNSEKYSLSWATSTWCVDPIVWQRCTRLSARSYKSTPMSTVARPRSRTAIVGSPMEVPSSEQSMKMVGVPLGRDGYATSSLEKKSECHDTLFQKIPVVPDVQANWLLLSFCAATRT